MSSCQRCTRKTELHLCTPCTHVLDDLLAELPWLLHELDVTITRQDKLVTSSTLHTLNNNASPLNVGAMELARTAALTLTQIALDVAQIYGDARPSALVNATPALVTMWLRRNLNAIQQNPQAGTHYRAIANLVGETHAGQIHRAINRADTRFAGPCPTIRAHNRHGDALRCNTMLYAHDGEPFVTCTRCKADINVDDNRRRTAAANDLLPEQLLRDVLDALDEHVPRVTMSHWITSGKLPPLGYLTRTGIQATQQRRTDPRVFSLLSARQLRRTHIDRNDDDACTTQTL